MSALERSALILGNGLDRVEPFMPTLRRSNLAVRRVVRSADALQLVYETSVDLVVVVLPVVGAEKVLSAVRAEGSASRRAGVVVIGEGEGHEESDLTFGRLANRLLPPVCSTEEYERTATTLLDVAPRIELRGPSRLKLRLASGSPPDLEVANLSASGMLVAAAEPLPPLGAVLGFALELPTESEPVRGQAQVVRLARPKNGGERGFAVRFLVLGGEGPERLRALVRREHANANETADADGVERGMTPDPSLAALEVEEDEATRCREELAELVPVLEDLLRRGLTRRLAVADWYLTGAELGLESLRAFSTILASVHEERAMTPEATRRLADLVEVRRKLADLGKAQNDLAARVRILLGLRPALERLLLEMAEGGPSEAAAVVSARNSGVVAQVVVDIKRLVGAKRSLERLHGLLEELRSPRFFLARGSIRKPAERIRHDHGALAASLGIDLSPDRLARRGTLRATIEIVERELRGARRRLSEIHQKAFSLRFRRLATDDVDGDLLDPKLYQVLVETLAAGSDYLVRAYSAYRHALEATGAEPALLDRAARLTAALAAAERATTASAATLRRPREPEQRTDAPKFDGVGRSWSFETDSAIGGRDDN